MKEVFTTAVIDGGNYHNQQELKKTIVFKTQFEVDGQWWCWKEINHV